MRGSFDFQGLREFLKRERTYGEIMKEFRLKSRNEFMRIITDASYKMPLYEYSADEWHVIYGVVNGDE